MTRDMRYHDDGDALPGSDRERGRYRADSFPMIAREAVSLWADPNKSRFPFESWAAASRFRYDRGDLATYCQCESAAEAFFLRGFFDLPVDRRAHITVALQVRVGSFRVDLVAATADRHIAVEIDGLTYHARSKEAIAADYLRQRRIVCAGYTVVRFTAQETFADAAECWRQILIILAARPLVPSR